jgi:hypothetical protein
MGQTLSEPVVEKVRVCAVFILARRSRLELQFGGFLSLPRDFILPSTPFSVSLSLVHIELMFSANMLLLPSLLLTSPNITFLLLVP